MSEEYGLEIAEVVETFHVAGKCVGCGDSVDSWCRKYKRWGYAIDKCGNEVPVDKKPEVLVHARGRRIPHNAKAVICSNGVRYNSILLAATAVRVSPLTMRNIIKKGHAIKKLTFAWEVK